MKENKNLQEEYQLPKPYNRDMNGKISQEEDMIYKAIHNAIAKGLSKEKVQHAVADALDMATNLESPSIYRRDMAMKYLGKSSRPWMEKKESNNVAKFNEYYDDYDYEEPDYYIETTWDKSDFEDSIEIVFPKDTEFNSEFIGKLNVAFQYFNDHKDPDFNIFDYNIGVENEIGDDEHIRNVNYDAAVELHYENEEDVNPTIEIKDTEEGKVISISVDGSAEFEAELGAECGFSYDYGNEHGYHSLGREIGDYYAKDSDLHNLIVSDFETMLDEEKIPYIKVK